MRSKTRIIWTGTILVCALLAAPVISPALAAGGSSHPGGVLRNAEGRTGSVDGARAALASAVIRRPDGRIRDMSPGHPGFPLVGNNIYNTTGAHQRVLVSGSADFSPSVFGISIQNDGTGLDRFKVKASLTASNGWRVKYFHGITNITAAVIAGTYRTPSLLPAARYLITVKATLKGPSLGSVSRLVTISSAANPARKDAVRFAIKVVMCGC